MPKNEKLEFVWVDYDTSWLAFLLEKEHPTQMTAIASLRKYTRARRTSYPDTPKYSYVYFVDPKNPNQPNSAWQYKRTISIFDWPEGDLRLDIMKDGSVGGFEMAIYPASTTFSEAVRNEIIKLARKRNIKLV